MPVCDFFTSSKFSIAKTGREFEGSRVIFQFYYSNTNIDLSPPFSFLKVFETLVQKVPYTAFFTGQIVCKGRNFRNFDFLAIFRNFVHFSKSWLLGTR